MKTKVLFLSILIFAFSINHFSQGSSVAVTSKKDTYQRKGANVAEHKRTFEVNYPKFSGITNPKVKKNLENAIDYWINFDTTLAENMGEYNWLDSLDYKINYNKNHLLEIELIMEGSGAYPDGSVKTLLINLNTGKRITLAYAFTNLGQLLVKIDNAQKAEIKRTEEELKEQGQDLSDFLDRGDYKISKLDEFSITDEGVTFLYDYGFPHVAKALEPEGRYFFTWAEMKPFINSASLLGQFVR